MKIKLKTDRVAVPEDGMSRLQEAGAIIEVSREEGEKMVTAGQALPVKDLMAPLRAVPEAAK